MRRGVAAPGVRSATAWIGLRSYAALCQDEMSRIT
jgi:hypothetical protein